MSSNYFDQTIFTTGEIFRDYVTVNVANKADAWILENVHNKTVSWAPCAVSGLEFETDIFVNPTVPCANSKNIYTINLPGNPVTLPLASARFNKLLVHRCHTAASVKNRIVPLTLAKYKSAVIYDIPESAEEITAFDAAIMIYYYAMTHEGVEITSDLLRMLMPYLTQDNQYEYINHATTRNIDILVARSALKSGQILHLSDKPLLF